ncbi:ARGOS protein [Melia azedarach]|uniref:ARGOS protein n=1 Tax=Melia azedarach TaxID=155640 RepID=A0ACC1YJT7_MELAZ|nr:ARGOS protein [Melia azedarach]
MTSDRPESRLRLSKDIINLQDRYSSRIMNEGMRKMATPVVEKRKVEYHRSYSQGTSRRLFPASYFSLESLLLLLGLTVSLLILPLILPPLPPPPFMLLLVPIGILAVLLILAFMPSNVRDITYTYV